MIESVLEQLLLVRGSLPQLSTDQAPSLTNSVPSRKFDTSVRLGRGESGEPNASAIDATADQAQQFGHLRLSVPIIVRSITQEELGQHWTAFCALLRKRGIPLCCHADDLESLGAESLPLKFGRRSANKGFDQLELQTSDAFELASRQEAGPVWAWPSEIGSQLKLGPLVEAVRAVLDRGTPVGIALPVGATKDDLLRSLDAGIDFITLVAGPGDHCEYLLVSSLALARETCASRGETQLPIILDAPLREIKHVTICLALGASVVSADCFLRPLIHSAIKPKAIPLGSGMLSGINSPMETIDPVVAVDELFRDLMSDLERNMQACNTAELSALNQDFVRGVTESAARIARVPLL